MTTRLPLPRVERRSPDDESGATVAPLKIRIEPTARGLGTVALAIAACWIALKLLSVLLVLVVALFVVGTLNPAVEWLEKKRWKRGWGIAVAFSVMFVVAALSMTLTIPSLIDQVSGIVKQAPALKAHLADVLAKSPPTAPLAETIRHFDYDDMARQSASTALQYSTRALTAFAYLISAVFLALYMMIDRDRLRGAFFATVPRTHHVREPSPPAPVPKGEG